MKVLGFISYYLPGYKGGGPIKTVKNLLDEIDQISFRLITSDRDLGDSSPYSTINQDSWNKVGNAEIFYVQAGLTKYKQIYKILFQREYDIVYLNSFFSPTFSIFPLLVAKTLGQKVIIGPRGEFSGGALSLKSRKKLVFIKFYKALRLHRDTVFQASSAHEAKDVRSALGFSVDVQVAEDIGAREFVETLPIRKSNVIRIVFISRISPMKNLLEAIKILKDVQNAVSYDIYGPIEDHEYWSACKAVIEILPSHVKVEYKGELHPEEVITTLSMYDLFFMPTKGENYGHVIAEALCAGLPILIADTTPWRNLQELGIGWDLPLNNPKAFSNAIDQLAVMPINEHHSMREKVLVWAKDKFSQRDAIDANLAMFEYVANK